MLHKLLTKPKEAITNLWMKWHSAIKPSSHKKHLLYQAMVWQSNCLFFIARTKEC